jgi:hypothetical protein
MHSRRSGLIFDTAQSSGPPHTKPIADFGPLFSLDMVWGFLYGAGM